MIRRSLLLLFIMAALLGTFHGGVGASPEPPRILFIDLPRFSMAEITDEKAFPNLHQLFQTGSAGLVTVPFPDPVTPQKVYYSINSGSRVKTVTESDYFFNVTENYNGIPAGEVYQTLSGRKAPREGGVNLGLARTWQVNKEFASRIGLLGKTLHLHGIGTAVIGNADTDNPNRNGAILVMDNQGVIDFTALDGETLRKDLSFPFGHRTDPDNLFAWFERFFPHSGVTVVTLGDLERVERFRLYTVEDYRAKYRRQVLAEYDQLLGRMMMNLPENTLVILFSAVNPEEKTSADQRLMPILLKGPGFLGGLLYSRSTRKAGIISCYDLAATIFRFMGIPAPTEYTTGQPLVSRDGDWQSLTGLRNGLIQNYLLRFPLLTGYGYFLIFLVLAAGVVLFFRLPAIYFRCLTYGYLFFLTIPAVFLLEALVNPLSWPGVLGWTIGLGAIFFCVAMVLSRGEPFRLVTMISMVTTLLIIVDGCGNGIFQLRAFLGYSAVAGARFYGLGNEYLGFLLGAFITAVSLQFERTGPFRSIWLWIGVLGLGFFLAHPFLGANIGGGITAILGLGITTYLWLGRSIHWKEIVVLIVTVIVVLILLGLWESLVSNRQMTHFGQWLQSIRTNGLGVLFDVLRRKWELNWQLINYTPWTKVLLGLLVLVGWLYKKPPSSVARLLHKYPRIFQGFIGLVITGVIALFTNDSGIVTMATMYIFGIGLLWLVIFREWGSLSKELTNRGGTTSDHC